MISFLFFKILIGPPDAMGPVAAAICQIGHPDLIYLDIPFKLLYFQEHTYIASCTPQIDKVLFILLALIVELEDDMLIADNFPFACRSLT